MTTYEADSRRITFFAAVVTVCLTFLLAQTSGIVGIAWAATICIVCQHVAGSVAAKK